MVIHQEQIPQEQNPVTLSGKMFQLSLAGNEHDIKLRFCEFFIEEVSKLSGEELVQYLNSIVLERADKSFNLTFKFCRY